MDIKAALFSFLQSKALVTGLVSDRIYPDVAPQGTISPYIVYEENDSTRPGHLGGASAYCDAMFTFTVHASTSDSRDAVKEALRNVMHGRLNVQQSDGVTTVNIRSITLMDTPNKNENPPDGSETGDFSVEMDFRVIFLEAAPTLP